LPLWAELLLLPCLTMIGLLAAVAERQAEHHILIGPLNGVLGAGGLFILTYSIYQSVIGWDSLNGPDQAREFALPILLTLMFLPFLYGVMVTVSLETAAIRLNFKMQDEALRRYAWRAGILRFGAHVGTFSRYVRALQMSDVKGRADVKAVIQRIQRARRREKRPVATDWALGWSPHEARAFLAGEGLRAEPYDPGMVDWNASSERHKLTDEFLSDTLVYHISGTETAVTELIVELDLKKSEQSGDSDNRFWIVATTLILRALGDEPASRFIEMIPTDEPLDFNVGGFTVAIKREEWTVGQWRSHSRSITIRHPAYVDPFAHLSADN